MPPRPKDIYHGRRKRFGLVTIILFIAAALLVAAAVLFYVLQQYIVYDQDGVHLELPFLAESASAPAGESAAPAPSSGVVAEVVIDEPTFEDVQTDAGRNVDAVKAVYVPQAGLTAESLPAYVQQMRDAGASALYLDMKPESGLLSWASTADMSVSYATGGADISALLEGLKAEGIYLAARVCVCVDALMATRNPPIALKTADGAVYADAQGLLWLDPYSKTVRDYNSALAAELAGMGFDEVVFCYVSHPEAEGEYTYSESLTGVSDVVTAVCNMALRLSESAGALDCRISAEINTNSLLQGLSARTGQDVGFFFTVFDRLWCPTDGDNLQSCLDAASACIEGSAENRIVPVLSYAVSETGSWAVRAPE